MTTQSVLSRAASQQETASQFRNPDGRSALDNLCRPALVEMQSNFFALQFDLMKIVPARFILETALKTGELQPGGLVVETVPARLRWAWRLCARILACGCRW
ncbi:MAG: hypothetical protein U0Y68_16615 [Blastocatellia bacterium]